jgi:hypothetical protein
MGDDDENAGDEGLIERERGRGVGAVAGARTGDDDEHAVTIGPTR